MRFHLRRTIRILKATIIGCAIAGSIILGVFRPELQASCQSFDLMSSAIISLGFSSALCLLIYDSKKQTNEKRNIVLKPLRLKIPKVHLAGMH